MKKILFNIALLACFLFASCSDDDNVNIVSLNTFGTKFCRNDVVKVFVSAEVGDDSDVSYEWGCDAGKLTNPQGLFENVWKAPNEAGTYEVWCTVKNGGKKQTRRTKMVVTDELFYSSFETPYYNEGWSNASMTVAFDANKGTNGAVKLTSGKADGRFARSWENVSIPFSTQVDYAVNTSPQDSCFVEIRLEFARIDGAMNYVAKACFTTFPKTGKWKATYTTTDVMAGEDTEVVMGEGTDTANFKFKKDAFNTIAASIDANKNFIVYYNGKKYFENDALAKITGQQYNVSRSGFGLENKVIIFADNLYVFDPGTICTAEPRER